MSFIGLSEMHSNATPGVKLADLIRFSFHHPNATSLGGLPQPPEMAGYFYLTSEDKTVTLHKRYAMFLEIASDRSKTLWVV